MDLREGSGVSSFYMKVPCRNLVQPAQRSGGVTIPGGAQEVCRCGTEGCILVGSVGGRWMAGLGDLGSLFQH